MKANETLLIADSSKRQLTARGYKFLEKMRFFAAEMRGVTRFHSEMKTINEQIGKIVTHLIIDRKLSEAEIKEIVKNSVNQKKEINTK